MELWRPRDNGPHVIPRKKSRRSKQKGTSSQNTPLYYYYVSLRIF
jgi:hypothetical protein